MNDESVRSHEMAGDISTILIDVVTDLDCLKISDLLIGCDVVFGERFADA